MTKKEFIHTANELKQVVDENLIMFVLVEGKEAGFIVCLPDYNQVFKKIPTGKLHPTGIFKLLRAKKVPRSQIRHRKKAPGSYLELF